jgi:hypothetical protein
MPAFIADYFSLAVLGTIGAIQVAATFSKLDGLLFIRHYTIARLIGLAIVVSAFVWFFSTGDRNLNDHEGGMDSNGQALYFFLGAAVGTLATLAVSSIINFRMKHDDLDPRAGLDALKHTNHLQAVTESIAHWSKNWRSWMKRYFSG